MKEINYYFAKALVKITGIIFFFQVIIKAIRISTTKPGFEWVIYASGFAFGASLLYMLVLFIINEHRRSKKTPNV